MSNLASSTSQAVGAENANKLKKWIKATPLHKVPLNSRGGSAKRTVCRLLGISPSTVGTNAAIKSLFDELDNKLKDGVENVAGIGTRNTFRDLESSDAGVGYLLDELEELRASNARLRHLDVTGQFITE